MTTGKNVRQCLSAAVFACIFGVLFAAAAATQPTPINRLGGETGTNDALPGAALKGTQAIFSDGFEAPAPPIALDGDLRLGRDPYFAPAPEGSQLESLSNLLELESSLRFLQADTSLVERVSPDPARYLSRVDFERMNPTPGGIVEAPLTPVDLSLSNPSASTSGCEASDFNGFPRGHIALVQRGTCAFYIKAANAADAGAVGVVIFNQGTAGRTALFSGVLENDSGSYQGNAPVIAVSFALGQEWAANPGASFRLRVDVGMRSNAWSLKPVVRPDAEEGIYWVRNATTGEVLYSGATAFVSGVSTRELELGQVDADDRNAWWQLEAPDNQLADPNAMRLRNVETNQYLATRVSNGNVLLLTSGDVQLRGTLCLADAFCDQWLLDAQFRREPGATRLRSSLGNVYLHLSDGLPTVNQVRPGWAIARWVLEPVPGTIYRRLLNTVTGDYLHLQNGGLEAGTIEQGWLSAQWELEDATQVAESTAPDSDQVTTLSSPITGATGYTRIRNRGTGQLLLARNGSAVAGTSNPDQLQALWVLDDEPINVPDANLKAAINTAIGQSADSDILSSEAAGIYVLWAGDSGITNIEGLQNLFNLRDLRMAGNSFLNTGPLSALEELVSLDLSRNAFTTAGGLTQNPGLARGDRILLLQSALGGQDPDEGEALFSQGAIVIPAPGLTALQYTNTFEVVDTSSSGNLDLVDPTTALNGANWAIEYDPARGEFFLRNFLFGYLTWEDQNNNMEFIDRNNPEWVFEAVGTGVYQIRNTRLSGSRPYLLYCDGELGLNVEVVPGDICVTGTWFIDPTLIQSAIDRALANFYDPRFSPPDSGFTRIQNTKSREFLHLENGPLEIGEVDESSTGAQWAFEPVQSGIGYFFAIRNRLRPTQYLYRDDSGAVPVLRAGPLPGSPPGGPTWATDPAQAAFLFNFDGLDSYTISPLANTDSSLAASGGQVSFVDVLNSQSFWRIDNAIRITAPAEPSGFIELKLADDPLYVTDYELSWLEPTGPGGQFVEQTRSSAGVYVMPAESRNIRATAYCVGCDFFSDLKIMDRTWDRPPNVCLETRGQFFDPHYAQCDPTTGSLVTFAANATEQAACEILELVEWIPTVFEEISLERIAKRTLAGNFDAVRQEFFNLGDMRGPDFSANCRSYNSLSFGAGASVGALAFDTGGGTGFVWDLNDTDSGARTYTSSGGGSSAGLRLVSADVNIALGLWRAPAEEFAGESVGVSVGGKIREVRFDLRKFKKAKKLGLSAGITLWYKCDTGDGLVVSSEFCDLKEDSTYLGMTFEVSGGASVSLPVPDGIGVIYSVTCSPADFEAPPLECR